MKQVLTLLCLYVTSTVVTLKRWQAADRWGNKKKWLPVVKYLITTIANVSVWKCDIIKVSTSLRETWRLSDDIWGLQKLFSVTVITAEKENRADTATLTRDCKCHLSTFCKVLQSPVIYKDRFNLQLGNQSYCHLLSNIIQMVVVPICCVIKMLPTGRRCCQKHQILPFWPCTHCVSISDTDRNSSLSESQRTRPQNYSWPPAGPLPFTRTVWNCKWNKPFNWEQSVASVLKEPRLM